MRTPKDPSPQLSDRAASVLAENVTATSHVNVAHRAAVFRHNLMTFRSQQWYLSAGSELSTNLADLWQRDEIAVEQWLVQPSVGARLFPLSCQGCKVTREVLSRFHRPVNVAKISCQRSPGARVPAARRANVTWSLRSAAQPSWPSVCGSRTMVNVNGCCALRITWMRFVTHPSVGARRACLRVV